MSLPVGSPKHGKACCSLELCAPHGADVPRVSPYIPYHDEDEDLIVDFSTGSLQATSLKTWQVMEELMGRLERL
ncbi:ABR099W-Ap [Eremothecium gossypii ATCC 10895]|uniref:ABR099W-Ap n=1 Tax=Eremothecium gossypii (strain ATCC 10895 / CBS 109.51 / FGSC 9923 / NRRL Y-1056) TaxID=284811 RepID=Q75DC7_EREGS|nr:ABR099W-Ap [Eremothecium gossypii ATCC 10895]AAS50870.1 ABR099W-Ap [Eremothecium gossypii ATCC 10895]AEY95159.1 FABR099W-Ap [Eremothecium gossypii FDAG1]